MRQGARLLRSFFKAAVNICPSPQLQDWWRTSTSMAGRVLWTKQTLTIQDAGWCSYALQLGSGTEISSQLMLPTCTSSLHQEHKQPR
jgi:hypothetical protein